MDTTSLYKIFFTIRKIVGDPAHFDSLSNYMVEVIRGIQPSSTNFIIHPKPNFLANYRTLFSQINQQRPLFLLCRSSTTSETSAAAKYMCAIVCSFDALMLP
jgi:hypothetical protein